MGYVEKPILEFKIKKGLVGRKELYSIMSFLMRENITTRFIKNTVLASGIDAKGKNLIYYSEPILYNQYNRQYYLSADKRYRLTVDSMFMNGKLTTFGNLFARKQINPYHCIVELKYLPEHSSSAHEVTSLFPFRLTKSSKYVMGMRDLGMPYHEHDHSQMKRKKRVEYYDAAAALFR